MTEGPLIRVRELRKLFPVRRSVFDTILSREELYIHAVDKVSFDIQEEEVLGLVGESGCGKTTLGRLLIRLIEPTSGDVYYRDTNITELSQSEMKEIRPKMQIIFQDPYESLNPRMTILDLVGEPLEVNDLIESEADKLEQVSKILELVRLTPPEDYAFRYPHELSGGQRQRIAVARALIIHPDFVVADEPVSMLDTSTRGEILNLMMELKGLTRSYLFITHELAVARHFCDRIAIMYLGRIMEMADSDEIVRNPVHPYTRALMEATPVPDPSARKDKVNIKGEVVSPINPPRRCRFYARCIYGKEACSRLEPELVDIGGGHLVACHMDRA
ncbi:MAG: ATP-binding cassette domain-containing protein [Candidatus Bathyarchaeota archaeon]|nr:ATP-binding cassette domain-containing protein [Candidatus Bathyarchaeota archaeon]MCW3991119.1 ATP-binding cassette domain-containing protein [Candidatus Bathyarchaeota archaeon]